MNSKRLDLHAGERSVRLIILTVITALALAACGGGTDTAAETVTGNTDEAAPGTTAETGGVSDSSNDDAPPPSGGSSDYCQAIQRVFEDSAEIDEENSDFGDLYTFLLDMFEQLEDDAPSELESDFAVVKDGLQRYAVWVEDPLQPDPLSEAEQVAFEQANERIDTYTSEECGFDMGVDDEDDSEIVYAGDPSVGEDSTATQIIMVGGETYEEALSGGSEVSCDLYGDSETGSVGIYLDGPEFQSSISSYDTGVQLGTHEGLIWVFAWDTALDELTWDLQEIDGTFVLSRAEEVSEGEWLLEGSFSAAVEGPSASITATFSCTGIAY